MLLESVSCRTLIDVQHSSVMFAFAGIAFFMFGMTMASESLQKLAANRVRDLLNKMASRPYLGVGVGILLTLMIQSSGAVTSMLVGLGSAGVVTLSQVMSVIIGSAVGTTFTVQLLSFKITEYGLPIFATAFSIYFFSGKRRALKQIMKVIMGFGLIFWGLELIGVGTNELRTSNLFIDFLSEFRSNPLLAVAATALFTAIVHSSAVTIGFSMSLASAGMISLTDAMFWVYGANIGTTATALLAASGGNFVARQVAWAHTLYKVASVVLFYFFTSMFAEFMDSGAPARDIANAHTVFNVVAAVAFFFLIKWGIQLVEYVIRPSASERSFSVKYLGRSDYQSTSVAIAHVERELMRMGDIVSKMVGDSLDLFRNKDPELIEKVKDSDDRVDLLNREISMFLVQIMEGANAEQQSYIVQLMSFSADLETVGDVIDNNLLALAEKKHSLKLEFSAQGWEELDEFHRTIVELTSLSLSCFQTSDRTLASKVVFLKREIRKAEKSMRETHMERLVKGTPETLKSSAIHLDMISEYRRIAGLMANHVYSLMKDTDKYNIFPRRDIE